MTESDQKVVAVEPGGGDAVWLVGDLYTTKLSGAQTGGAFTLLEATVPKGSGPPPHAHLTEDETFIVLSGSLELTAGDVRVTAEPGSVFYVPKGVMHSFKTISDEPAKMLFMYNPAGMEGMFPEIGTPAISGEPIPPLSMKDVEAMIGIAAKYHFTMPPPE